MNIIENLPDDVLELLDELGFALGSAGVEIVEFDLAGECYVHHTQKPIALTAYAQVSLPFARGRFPDFSFLDLIRKRPSMDEREAAAFAAVCGVEVAPPFWGNVKPFAAHLWNVIDKYELGAFFVRTERSYGEGDHQRMRPRGFDWNDPEQPEIPGALAQWRKDFRALSPARQLMVATVLQLYMQKDDKYWMVRVPKKWHAAEGVEILRDAGYLKDWSRLVALYPGW